MDKWKDIYVTDHEPKDKKYFTLNKSEDEHFFNYKKSLEEYTKSEKLHTPKSHHRYEKGTFL